MVHRFKSVLVLALIFLTVLGFLNPILAADDPRNNPNNKVGVGLLSPDAEIPEAAQMINNNGNWGWAVIIITKSERNLDRWQSVFNLLAKYHLIPIVRIATSSAGGVWQKPDEQDAADWADFLSKLYWPTKNRYVQIYNEVNHANEWGGSVDPAGYAKELDETAKLLKGKNGDFFVLNSPMDLASATTGSSLDAGAFFEQMDIAVPGIFKEIDGWASHSYPNPDFSASPLQAGRLGIGGYLWELSQIQQLGAGDIPVFITETGWRRSNQLSEDTIADYYKVAFEKVWNDKNVVAVCPFIFDYRESPYAAFSFKTDGAILGEKYYKYFSIVRDLAKENGNPSREDLVSDLIISVPPTVIYGFAEKGTITFKNSGNYVWNTNGSLKFDSASKNIKIENAAWEKDEIYPGESAKLKFTVNGGEIGESDINISISGSGKVLATKSIKVKNETLLTWLFEILNSLG